jgi:LacI family transcriptional regulator
VLEQPFRTRAQLWDRDQSRLISWLMELPKPVAVFATNDLLGHHVLDACGVGELSAPEQVAVLGVDNDELLCGLCDPPLSSINPDPERIGYEAASWLDRMMKGERTPDEAFLEVPPLGIVVRQSSDIFAVPDEDFATALRFIREHACDGITVKEVAEHVAVSRSWLERHFRLHLNRSPQAEIRNVQIKRCKELLRDTDLPLRTISRLAGFKHIEYMSVVFKRLTGESPGHYRNLKR